MVVEFLISALKYLTYKSEQVFRYLKNQKANLVIYQYNCRQ